MSIEDQPTQQIHRPTTPAPAPLPGPLNLNSAGGQAAATTSDEATAGSTEVLSLDELFERPQPAATQAPSRPVEAPRVEPVASFEAPRVEPAAPVAAPRIGAVPVSSASPTAGKRNRVLGDASQAWRGGLDRSRAWVTSGDNAVIVATVVIAVLLLLAIALF